MYNFKKASDLVKWAEEQYKKPNYYKNGGIGRYDGQYRQFDCCGLFKCFMWHDYSQKNAKYYNVTQKDYNCEQLIAEAKEKGTISTIPEIPGILVYQKGHMGIYVGNGQVVESTAAKFNGKNGKIYKTYFKGNGKGCNGKRTTWTHWFKSPYLIYEAGIISKRPTKSSSSSPSNFLGKRGWLKYGDSGENVHKLCQFFANGYYGYFGNTKKSAHDKLLGEEGNGDYFGPNLKAWVTDFQRRTGLEADGNVGPLTLKKLVKYGFRY